MTINRHHSIITILVGEVDQVVYLILATWIKTQPCLFFPLNQKSSCSLSSIFHRRLCRHCLVNFMFHYVLPSLDTFFFSLSNLNDCRTIGSININLTGAANRQTNEKTVDVT